MTAKETLGAEPEPGGSQGDAVEPSYVGAVLGERYVLGAELGAGGMGVVHEARHLALGTRLAVKVLRREAAMPEATERFAREARAASAIGHPNIVDVLDMGTLADGTAYYVMEHLSGRDLGAELAASGRLEPGRAARIAAQIASALSAAHAHGVIHRDLKPENVFLTARRTPSGALDSDFVKVIDFGIAKLAGAPAEAPPGGEGAPGAAAPPAPSAAPVRSAAPETSRGRVTELGVILGTPAYMSPEQCAGRALDPRSDVYALGVVLYEMLSGAPPFDGEEPFEVMRRHELDPVPALAERGFVGPPALAALVARCLGKRPGDRPSSMAELEAALRAFVPEPAFAAPRFSEAARPQERSLPSAQVVEPIVTAPSASRTPAGPGTSRRALGAAALVGVAVFVAALWLAGLGLGRRAASATPEGGPTRAVRAAGTTAAARSAGTAPEAIAPAAGTTPEVIAPSAGTTPEVIAPSAGATPEAIVPADLPRALEVPTAASPGAEPLTLPPRPERAAAPPVRARARPPAVPHGEADPEAHEAPGEPAPSAPRRTAPTDLVADPWRE